MSTEIEFIKHAKTLRTAIDSKQFELVGAYGQHLEEVNQTLNLTRIPSSDYLTLHVLDSLMVAAVVDLRSATTLLDIGTGAGFPAVPLAIAFPHLQVIAMDARKKKLIFIEETAAKLGLKNISIQHARAEQAALALNGKGFDVVCSRALASYETLLAWQLPFVARGGNAVILKSLAQEKEIARAAPRGWSQKIERITLPGYTEAGQAVERLLVVLRRDR